MTDKEFTRWLDKHELDFYTAADWLALGGYHTAYQYAVGRRRIPDTVVRLMQYIDKYGLIKAKENA